jgi:Rrf2 family protein
MRITAKADYAVRAAVELAAAGEGPTKGEAMAEAQGIPVRFLENILAELRHAGLVLSQRGAEGGYRLARPASEISIADVIRAVEGPLASVRSEPAEELDYTGSAVPLQDVWLALRVNIRAVLEEVSLADVVAGELPRPVSEAAREG